LEEGLWISQPPGYNPGVKTDRFYKIYLLQAWVRLVNKMKQYGAIQYLGFLDKVVFGYSHPCIIS